MWPPASRFLPPLVSLSPPPLIAGPAALCVRPRDVFIIPLGLGFLSSPPFTGLGLQALSHTERGAPFPVPSSGPLLRWGLGTELSPAGPGDGCRPLLGHNGLSEPGSLAQARCQLPQSGGSVCRGGVWQQALQSCHQRAVGSGVSLLTSVQLLSGKVGRSRQQAGSLGCVLCMQPSLSLSHT